MRSITLLIVLFLSCILLFTVSCNNEQKLLIKRNNIKTKSTFNFKINRKKEKSYKMKSVK